MNEELGVLLLELQNSWFRYVLLTTLTKREKFTILETDEKEECLEYAYHCTRKEAEQFPQFKFVPLKELEELR
ncbi:hypothetical protein [Streptococcus parauberis]|uniref:hypothetical protein n=1 Tax=Streptococcus parauberis TaxID=1348 RepID=UPI0002EF320B|nr:hypothetical protein [Streptococcus parauberis]QBX27369.1 hypothetical protein Javan384_0034 [Streptococcus phage Javan384]UWM90529.1 hypothetical protein N2A94_08490 [Streptococcus parauberis]UWM91268.1 hypothetical protein N2A94_01185 [Streptococcus parauberis]